MRVPVESNQYSMNVPSAQPESLQTAGMVEQAIGQTLAGVAEAGNKINYAIMDEEAKVSVYDAQQSATAFASKRKLDLMLAYPDGYVYGADNKPVMISDGMGGTRQKRIEEEYYENLNSFQKDQYKSMPNGVAQTMYKENVLPQLNSAKIDFDSRVPAMRMEAAKVKQQEVVDRTSTDITSNGATISETYTALKNNALAVKELTIKAPGQLGTYDPTTAAALLNKQQEQLAKAWVESELSTVLEGKTLNDKTDVAKLTNLLNELDEKQPDKNYLGSVSYYEKKKGNKTVPELIPTEQREAYRARALSLLKEKKKKISDDLELRVSSLKSALKDTPKENVPGVDVIRDLVAAAKANPEHAFKHGNSVMEIFYANAAGNISKKNIASMNVNDARFVIKKEVAAAKAEAMKIISRMGVNPKEVSLLGATDKFSLFSDSKMFEGSVAAIIREHENRKMTNPQLYAFTTGQSNDLSKMMQMDLGDRSTWMNPRNIDVISNAMRFVQSENAKTPGTNDYGIMEKSRPTQLESFIKMLENTDPKATNEVEHAKFLLGIKQNPKIAPYFNALIKQSVETRANENLLVLTAFNDEATFKAAATSLFKKDFDKNYNDMFAPDEIKSQINEAQTKLQKEMEPYSDMITTDYGSGMAVKLSNSLSELVMVRAKAMYAAEAANKDKSDFGTYIEKARKEVIDPNFAVIDLSKRWLKLPVIGDVGKTAAGKYVGPRQINNVNVTDPLFQAHFVEYMKPLFQKDTFETFVKKNNIALPKMANGQDTLLHEAFMAQASDMLRVKASQDGKSFMLQFGTKDAGGYGIIRKQNGEPFTFTPNDVFQTEIPGNALANIKNANTVLGVSVKAQRLPGDPTKKEIQEGLKNRGAIRW